MPAAEETEEEDFEEGDAGDAEGMFERALREDVGGCCMLKSGA